MCNPSPEVARPTHHLALIERGGAHRAPLGGCVAANVTVAPASVTTRPILGWTDRARPDAPCLKISGNCT